MKYAQIKTHRLWQNGIPLRYILLRGACRLIGFSHDTIRRGGSNGFKPTLHCLVFRRSCILIISKKYMIFNFLLCHLTTYDILN